MKTIKILLPICFTLFCLTVFANKVPKERAKIVAENWGKNKMGKNSKAKIEQLNFIQGKDTSLYVFNFGDEGFVLISSDDNTYPVLAYSKTGNFDLANLSPEIETWLRYYAEMIKDEKKTEQTSSVKEKWEEVESGTFLKSTMTTVPSLFESSGSSRWASWRPYFNQAPAAQTQFPEGYNGCVPIALSQVMKYYEYPLIGTGSNSYDWNSTTISENFNHIFNYDIMPFRLTYCGRNAYNCLDTLQGWANIPGITQQQIDEVGKLQYLAGVSVNMEWLGNRTPPASSGTDSDVNSWVQSFVEHFYYSNDYHHWKVSDILNNTTGFKQAVRNSLNSGYPVYFQYSKSPLIWQGHAIVIDGYENDEFFHFIEGQGGYGDAYYYLFSGDANGAYLPRPYISNMLFQSITNLHPDCPTSQSITLSNITIADGEGELIQSGNNLTISNFTIESGGAAVLRANNQITISSNFEVEIGGEVLIISQPCSN